MAMMAFVGRDHVLWAPAPPVVVIKAGGLVPSGPFSPGSEPRALCPDASAAHRGGLQRAMVSTGIVAWSKATGKCVRASS